MLTGPSSPARPPRSPRLESRGRIEATCASRTTRIAGVVLHGWKAVAALKQRHRGRPHHPQHGRSPRLESRGRIEAGGPPTKGYYYFAFSTAGKPWPH